MILNSQTSCWHTCICRKPTWHSSPVVKTLATGSWLVMKVFTFPDVKWGVWEVSAGIIWQSFIFHWLRRREHVFFIWNDTITAVCDGWDEERWTLQHIQFYYNINETEKVDICQWDENFWLKIITTLNVFFCHFRTVGALVEVVHMLHL